MDLFDEILKLSGQGFNCSQILMILGTEEENPDLLRAVGALGGGMGFSGGACGALSGGCCLLGYHMGKGAVEETPDDQMKPLIQEYVDWFAKTYGTCDCRQILDGDWSNRSKRCPPLVESCFEKLMALLEAREV